jgi:septation ring formation regulator EzrA
LYYLVSTTGFIAHNYNQYVNAYLTEWGYVNADLAQAEKAFNTKRYKQAIPFFKAILRAKK